jgi:hypothetical protein
MEKADQMNLSELLNPVENLHSTQTRKAILWGPESLLTDSVEHFLKTGAAWDVVKISSESGIDYLIQQVRSIKPATIILCQETDNGDKDVLMQLDQAQLCLKVVTVSMESNLIQVYSKHNVIMRDVSDLLSVVETRYLPNHTIKEVQEI